MLIFDGREYPDDYVFTDELLESSIVNLVVKPKWFEEDINPSITSERCSPT